ncbi:MAG: fasciclin domain-containing protein, partial [Blastocatellia bacterium]
PGRITMGEMTRLNSLRTMLKDDLLIDASRGLQINRARVIEPNIECRNGIIHIIDSVLTLKQRSKVRAGRSAAG